MECWVEIENYPNYLVSNEGEVARRRDYGIYVLRLRPDKDGYSLVVLYNENGPATKKFINL